MKSIKKNNFSKIKKIILIPYFLFSVILSAQNEKAIDSATIAFKAKLLTINRQGISDVEGMLNQINQKKVKFLNTKYEDFIFLKIDFTDTFYEGKIYLNHNDSVGRTLFGSCFYYLAFNKKNAKFYRLGGFDIVDIDDFIRDLEEQEVIIFKDLEGGNEIEGMDINCLYNYYQMKPKKRLRKGYSCFSKCSKEIVTKIGSHH